MLDKVRCPECKKPIGDYVLIRTTTLPGIGIVPVYDEKMDYRKSSRIGFGRGAICRTCAKKFFPNGVAYRVTVAYGNGRITPHFGIKQSGLFADLKEAEENAREMDRRRSDNDARIETIKV